MIKKDTRWKRYFDFVITLVACYSIFVNAYYAVFGLPETPWEITIDLSVELLFLADMLFCFFEEYIDEETYSATSDVKLIAKHYLKSSFVFDFVAWIPLEYLMARSSGPETRFAGADKFRLIRLLKLLRIPRLRQLLNLDKFKELVNTYYGFQLKRAVSEKDDYFVYPVMRNMLIFNAYKICNFVFVILATAYFLAIFWMLSSLDFQSDWRDNWASCPSCVDAYNGQATFYTLEKHAFLSWTSEPDEIDERIVHEDANGYWVTDLSDQQILIKSFYYSLTTLTTIGFGDMSPVSHTEKVFGNAILLLGVAVFSIFISNLKTLIERHSELSRKGYQTEL